MLRQPLLNIRAESEGKEVGSNFFYPGDLGDASQVHREIKSRGKKEKKNLGSTRLEKKTKQPRPQAE